MTSPQWFLFINACASVAALLACMWLGRSGITSEE